MYSLPVAKNKILPPPAEEEDVIHKQFSWVFKTFFGLTSSQQQFVRYLAVGGANTLFSYGLFALFTYLLTGRIPHAYVVASLLNGLLNINIAFVCHKYFVFRTRENYLREYRRCLFVYGTGALLFSAILPVFVWLAAHTFSTINNAPYWGGAILTVLYVLVTFVVHKMYSFKVCHKTTCREEA